MILSGWVTASSLPLTGGRHQHPRSEADSQTCSLSHKLSLTPRRTEQAAAHMVRSGGAASRNSLPKPGTPPPPPRILSFQTEQWFPIFVFKVADTFMPLNAKHYIQSRYLQIAAGLEICLLGVNTLQRARLPQRRLEAAGATEWLQSPAQGGRASSGLT